MIKKYVKYFSLAEDYFERPLKLISTTKVFFAISALDV